MPDAASPDSDNTTDPSVVLSAAAEANPDLAVPAEQAEFRTADVPVQDLLPVRDTSVADIPDSDTPDHCTHSGNRSDYSVPCVYSFWSFHIGKEQ